MKGTDGEFEHSQDGRPAWPGVGELVIATSNSHKVREFNVIFGEIYHSPPKLLGLSDFGISADAPETGESFSDNSIQKLEFYRKLLPECDVLCEDSGFCVEALGGSPGVLSARFAASCGGYPAAFDEIAKALDKEGSGAAKTAFFCCCIAASIGGNTYTSSGAAYGELHFPPASSGGFGYDPIFVPKGYNITFAEMDSLTKCRISHRFRAIFALAGFVSQAQG